MNITKISFRWHEYWRCNGFIIAQKFLIFWLRFSSWYTKYQLQYLDIFLKMLFTIKWKNKSSISFVFIFTAFFVNWLTLISFPKLLEFVSSEFNYNNARNIKSKHAFTAVILTEMKIHYYHSARTSSCL